MPAKQNNPDNETRYSTKKIKKKIHKQLAISYC